MNEQYFVAKTAAGRAHLNTLVLRRLWTVVIFLDEPGNRQDVDDSYQLLSDEGLYDKTLQRSEAVRHDEQRLALRFTEVIPKGTYSLYHRLSCGVEFPVFMEVPFADLEDHGEETPESSNETWELPTFHPEPEPVSGDPLLLHDKHDHALPELIADWSSSDSDPTDPAPSRLATA